MAAEAPRTVRGLDFAPRGDVFPSPADWRDLVFYQLLVDRFDDNKDHPFYDPATARGGRDLKQGAVLQGRQPQGDHSPARLPAMASSRVRDTDEIDRAASAGGRGSSRAAVTSHR